jgi:hypothetical protein
MHLNLAPRFAPTGSETHPQSDSGKKISINGRGDRI